MYSSCTLYSWCTDEVGLCQHLVPLIIVLKNTQLCTCLHEAVTDLSIDCAQVLEGLLALAVVIVEKEPQVEDIASYWVDAVDSADAVTLVLKP